MSKKLTILIACLYAASLLMSGSATLMHMGYYIKPHESISVEASLDIVDSLIEEGVLLYESDSEAVTDLAFKISDIADLPRDVSHRMANFCMIIAFISLIGMLLCIASLGPQQERNTKTID